MEEKGYKPAFQQEVTGEVKRKPLDISEHVGKKVAIASITEIPRSNDGQGLGKYGPCIKVETDVVDVVERQGGGEDIHIKGSKIYQLIENDDETIGWGGKLKAFLHRHKKEHYKELLGVEVQLIPKASSKDPDVQFLTFE